MVITEKRKNEKNKKGGSGIWNCKEERKGASTGGDLLSTVQGI